ncbi:hypothetical protein JW905_07310, partial [bacterium]|nr:hypothetical protein [candidate division CSSED10-310 bacterium]
YGETLGRSGYGLCGVSPHIGLLARGGTYAAVFEGDILVNGTIKNQLPAGAGFAVMTTKRPVREDVGDATLERGARVVELAPELQRPAGEEITYHVFLTPLGDCKGLYVSQKTGTSFTVKEQAGGRSNVGFDYLVVLVDGD